MVQRQQGLSDPRLHIRHGDCQAQLAMLPGDVIQSPEQLPEDDSLPARYHLLPGIEEPELDEVMVEEGGPVREAHQTLALDNAGDVESTVLQQRPYARDRGAMLDMGMESLQFLALTRQNLLEDR